MSAHSELIRLAAEMAQAKGMPSPYLEDHAFYVSTPMAERRRLIAIAQKAESQCQEWAIRLRMAADAIAADKSSVTPQVEQTGPYSTTGAPAAGLLFRLLLRQGRRGLARCQESVQPVRE